MVMRSKRSSVARIIARFAQVTIDTEPPDFRYAAGNPAETVTTNDDGNASMGATRLYAPPAIDGKLTIARLAYCRARMATLEGNNGPVHII
jgi:hypothetical protein